jgi:formylglycine-generating enzyme required for sulfatase activity
MRFTNHSDLQGRNSAGSARAASLVAGLALASLGCIGESAVRGGAPAARVSEEVPSSDTISRDAGAVDGMSNDKPYVFYGVYTDTVPFEDAAADDDARDAGAPADDAPPADAAQFSRGSSVSCQAGLLCGLPGSRGSCCEALPVPEGVVLMGRSLEGVDQFPVPNPEELPEHPLTVPAFSLDRYEVTVGRYRAFLDAWGVARPAEGDGANPAVPASGWQSAWNDELAQTRVDAMRGLHCDGGNESWTDAPGPNEERPMGCITWYEAFAFCIWDGGRLATEAEWERAAAGGDENRVYPWGNTEPDCMRIAPWHQCSTMSDAFAPVGSHPTGRGRWGHDDFAGSAGEWTLDYWGYYRAPIPLAGLTPEYPVGNPRTLRGLSFYGGMGDMRAADRGSGRPGDRYVRFGVRCAHDLWH